jgi:hypothetical protein
MNRAFSKISIYKKSIFVCLAVGDCQVGSSGRFAFLGGWTGYKNRFYQVV